MRKSSIGSEACAFLVRVFRDHAPSDSLGVLHRHPVISRTAKVENQSQLRQLFSKPGCTLHHPGNDKRFCSLGHTLRGSDLVGMENRLGSRFFKCFSSDSSMQQSLV